MFILDKKSENIPKNAENNNLLKTKRILNIWNVSYRLCSSSLSSQTETHILLECELTRAPRQVMLNSIINMLLKEQVFTLSQLNGLSQAAWKHILLFGHVKLKRPSILQLYDAVCDFLSIALTYL